MKREEQRKHYFEDFLKKAKNIHGNNYNYLNVEYKNSHTPIIIKCQRHGNFRQRPRTHIEGSGCPTCGVLTRTKKISMNQQTFVTRASKIHKNFYDYSLVEYKNSYTPIVIKCPKHRKFKQMPKAHSEGYGCPKCGIEVRQLTINELLKKFRQLHGNKYNYSKVDSAAMLDHIIIGCPKHGKFHQRVQVHLIGRGCPKCAFRARRLTQEQFIEKANTTHDFAYDYSLTKYIGIHSKVIVICSKHGEFSTEPSLHIQRTGCPKCSSSSGERLIRKILKKHNVKFNEQQTFPDCRNKYPLKFDFFLPNHNLLIEYDGKHHFELIYRSKNDTEEIVQQRHEVVKLHDKIKNEYALRNNMKLLRVKYDNSDIEQTVRNAFYR